MDAAVNFICYYFSSRCNVDIKTVDATNIIRRLQLHFTVHVTAVFVFYSPAKMDSDLSPTT